MHLTEALGWLDRHINRGVTLDKIDDSALDDMRRVGEGYRGIALRDLRRKSLIAVEFLVNDRGRRFERGCRLADRRKLRPFDDHMFRRIFRFGAAARGDRDHRLPLPARRIGRERCLHRHLHIRE